MRNFKIFLICIFLLITIAAVWAETHDATEQTLTHRMMNLAIQIGIILFAAKIGNMLFEKFKLPGVLGELTAGILIGPYLIGKISFYGFPQGLFPQIGNFPITPELYGFCTIASILLLFMVGMETDFRMFIHYALAGSVVGLGGVIFSFIGGDFLAVFLSKFISDTPLTFFSPAALFLGTISTATSVGITARILSEKKKIDSSEGVTILAGAVIDDVLGIIVLAIVMSFASVSKSSGSIDWLHISIVAARTIGFWLISTALGIILSKKISLFLKIFKNKANISLLGFGLALILSGLFEQAGLAMIIGAYIMGLSLSKTDIAHVIREKLHPVYDFLVPIFFCVMGMLVDLTKLANVNILIFGLIYTVVAILMKVIGASIPSLFFNFNLRGAFRIGVGMIPRGEVALIVAGIGLSAGFISSEVFGVAILMTLITTIVTPSFLIAMFNDKKGVKKETKLVEKTIFDIDFPTSQITDLLIDKLLVLFEREGFYVHLLDRDEKIYQIRKDDIIIGIQKKDTKIIFDSSKEQEGFIYTSLYMVMMEFEQTIKGLMMPLNKNEIAKKMQNEISTKKSVFDLSKYLSADLIETNLKGKNKKDILEELINILDKKGLINNKNDALKAIWERENIMSTGMQHGIAIPHGKTDSINELVCAIGLSKEGVDFNSLDGKLTNIFIITLSPKSKPAPHVQFMSSIAQALTETNRDIILKSKNKNEIFNIFINKNIIRKEKKEAADYSLTNLKKIIKPDMININLKGETKDEIIDELLKMVDKKYKLDNINFIKDEIIKRENLISTALSDGIAIPHIRTDSITELICAIGIKKKGILFDSIDKKPSYIIILTLSPNVSNIPHIQFMSAIIKSISSVDIKEIINIKNQNELCDLLTKSSFFG